MVPEIALYGFNIVPAFDGGYGVAVPQIVQAGVRQTDGRDNPFIIVVNRVWRKPLSDLVAKDCYEGSPVKRQNLQKSGLVFVQFTNN